MAQVKLTEEQAPWEPAEGDHSEVREFKEEPESKDIQSLEDPSSVLLFKNEEADAMETEAESLPRILHVSMKSEEPHSSALHQIDLDEEKLILEVESQSVLYDPSHPFYKDTDRKERIWTEMARVLKVDGIQSVQDTSLVLHCKKEEAEEVDIKAEPQFLHVSVKSEEGEPQSSDLHQTETEENREDTDAAGVDSQKPPETEQHSENSSDTDDSEDWAPSAERPTPQTQSELREQQHGPAHRNNVSEGSPAKRFICPCCGKGFQFGSHLRVHERTHTGERPYRCTVCEKGFIAQRDFNRHMRIHTGEKPYTCSVCTKGFAEKSLLKQHMRTHTGEKPFKCTFCEKAFRTKCNLNDHMRITHTEDKPYSCTVCQKDFKRLNSLNKHVRAHTERRSFKCLVCAKDFTEKYSLKSHMRTHTGEKPFKCTVCAKDFTVNSALTSHMRTHTGEKPFKCTVCTKDFTEKAYLIRHMRTHTGESPFTCLICGKDFTQTGSLKRHIMRAHTGEKPLKCTV